MKLNKKQTICPGTASVIARRCAVKYQNQDPCSMALNAAKQTGVNTQFEFCGSCEQDACNSGNTMQLFNTLIASALMFCIVKLFV